MGAVKSTPHTIFECLECAQQWAEENVPNQVICHWCFSWKTEKVCDMTEQIHLLQHAEAIC